MFFDTMQAIQLPFNFFKQVLVFSRSTDDFHEADRKQSYTSNFYVSTGLLIWKAAHRKHAQPPLIKLKMTVLPKVPKKKKKIKIKAAESDAEFETEKTD